MILNRISILTLFTIIILQACFSTAASFPSDSIASENKWRIGLIASEAVDFSGYVLVREAQYSGDKLSLTKHLGMKNFLSTGIFISYLLNNKSSLLSFSFQRNFFRGHSVLPNDIFFNGTLIKGSDGISINRTEFTRLCFRFEKSFNNYHKFYPEIIAGLLFDRILFKIDGTILPNSPRFEPVEGFKRQALPYPFLGVRLNRKLSAKSMLSIEASGTYIPLFKSFFKEGGPVYLKYYSADAALNYQHAQGAFTFNIAYFWRELRIYEYSEEDTNDFFLSVSGIRFTIVYRFNL